MLMASAIEESLVVREPWAYMFEILIEWILKWQKLRAIIVERRFEDIKFTGNLDVLRGVLSYGICFGNLVLSISQT